MEHLINQTKQKNQMYQPDFGNDHTGLLGICGTTLLYGTSLLTINAATLEVIHALSSIAATFAGIATGIYYIRKTFFNKKQ